MKTYQINIKEEHLIPLACMIRMVVLLLAKDGDLNALAKASMMGQSSSIVTAVKHAALANGAPEAIQREVDAADDVVSMTMIRTARDLLDKKPEGNQAPDAL